MPSVQFVFCKTVYRQFLNFKLIALSDYNLQHRVFCAAALATAPAAVLSPPAPQNSSKLNGFPLDVDRPSIITQSYPNPAPVI